jgi:hypothetical protein
VKDFPVSRALMMRPLSLRSTRCVMRLLMKSV